MPFGGLLTAGIGGGLGLLSGLFGKKQSQSGSVTPTYSADQTGLQGDLASALRMLLQNGGASLDPLKTAAIGGVNQTYAGAEKRLQRNYASRGFGQSGKVLTDARGLEQSRAGDIGGLESKFAAMGIDQNNHILDLVKSFAFANPGQKTEGNVTGGGGIGGGINSGLETFTTLYGLNKILSGGNSSKAPVFGTNGDPYFDFNDF